MGVGVGYWHFVASKVKNYIEDDNPKPPQLPDFSPHNNINNPDFRTSVGWKLHYSTL